MASTEPTLIDIPQIRDPRGNLTVIEHPATFPLDIARAYWIYDAPSDAERHGHAMLSQTELIIALTGSFDVAIVTPSGRKVYHLDRNYHGLLIPPLTWREIDNFATCSIALIVSSSNYDENDYIRDSNQFQQITQSQL